MNRFITKIGLFVPLALTIYVLIVCLWGDWMPSVFQKNLLYRVGTRGHMYSRMQEVKETRNVNVVFLGSSHTYRGFDTRIFEAAGFKSFNLGSSSQTPVQTKVLLNRYLERLNPQLVVFEVFPDNFIGDGVESSIDLIANDTNDWESIKMALTIHNITTYNTLIYGFYRDFFYENSNFVEEKVRGYDTYVKGGFVEQSMFYFKNTDHEPQEWKFEAYQLEAFEDILNSLKEKKIPFILVQAPVTAAYYRSYTNNEEFNKQMQNSGSYFNFNEITQLDDSLHFYDPHHLNQTGVEIFNRDLIEVLENFN